MAQSAGRQQVEKTGTATKKTTRAVQAAGSDAGNGVAHHMTDLDFLRGLIEAVDQSGIDSLEINRAGTRIRIAKTPATAAAAAYPQYAAPMPMPMPAMPPAPSAPASAAASAAAGGAAGGAAAAVPAAGAETAAASNSNLVDITSPMVGTFYRGPAPDAPPYVEPGTHVSKGQTLCILEAMKLMNELECEIDGIVREVLVEDADPVEFGQVLFRIEPAGSK